MSKKQTTYNSFVKILLTKLFQNLNLKRFDIQYMYIINHCYSKLRDAFKHCLKKQKQLSVDE